MSAKDIASMDIKYLPRDLYSALKEMEKDPLIKEAIGEHCYNCFLERKYQEWHEYAQEVHDWEIKHYLT